MTESLVGKLPDKSYRLTQITSAIQVQLFATSIESAISLACDDTSLSAKRKLERFQFSYAPVLNSNEEVVGVFKALDGRHGKSVGAAMRPVTRELLVSSDASVDQIAGFLAREPFLFLLAGRTVSGFITPSDMEKPEPRTFFYLLLAELEVTLARVVRSHFQDQEEAVALLAEGRRKASEAVQEDLRERDSFLDVVGTLNVADLIKIAKSLLRTRCNLTGIGWRELTGGLPGFRNDVMHPARGYTSADHEGMLRLHKNAERIRQLIQLCIEFEENLPSVD